MERKIGRFDLTTSIDAWGPEAEYARMGLKCDQFLKNFDYAVKEKWIVIHTQSVMTSLTMRAMPELLKILNDRRKNPHLTFTANEIPKVRSPKKITSSSGFLTGFLNLTIDKAPIIPRDKARLLEITFVITNAIGGNNK